MPFFVEYLYQLSERDQQVTWLDPSFRQDAVATAAVQVDAELAVDTVDRVLVLQTAVAQGLAGAAQSVNDLAIRIVAPDLAVGSGVLLAVTSDIAAGAGVPRGLNWSGSIIIPPRWRIVARGDYSAGAAVNTTTIAITGILLPVGNIQRV